jgi:hypothetical protein
MIVVLICVFGYALYDMYHRGYKIAYVEGGIYAHLSTMDILKKVLTKEELERVREALIKMGD